MRYFLIRMIGSDTEYLVSDVDAVHACHRVRKYILLYVEDVEDDLLPRDYEVRDMLQPEAMFDVLEVEAAGGGTTATFHALCDVPYAMTVQRLL